MHHSIDRRRKSPQAITDEIDIKELFEAILRYKKSILFVLILSILITTYHIYFKMPMYNSSALIEIKPEANNNAKSGDFLGSTFSDFGTEQVDRELELLKTFQINNLALKKVNFHTRYYLDSGFKQIELYNNSPITINNLTILDPKITWFPIQIINVDKGYKLKIYHSPFNKIMNIFFNNDDLDLDNQKIYKYGSEVKNQYFKWTIDKKSHFDKTISVHLNTNNRKIYENIRGNLQVTQINPSAPLIQISFTDSMRLRANEYVTAISESFIMHSVGEKSKRNDRIIDFINQQLAQIKKELYESESKLEEYRIKYKAINPTLQAGNYIQELSRVEIDLSRNKLNKLLVDELIKGIAKNQDIDSMAPLLMQLEDKSTLTLINKLQEVQIKKQIFKAQYSIKHPNYLSIQKQISLLKKKIKLNIKNLKVSVVQRNANLTKLKQVYEDNLKSLPTQERILTNLKRDYTVNEQTYEYLLRKKSENEMIKVTILSDYRIVDKAYAPNKKVGLTNLHIIIIGLILGLILGIIQALIRHYIDDTIKTKEDIVNLTAIPIYGLIPKLNQQKIKLEVLKDPKSPFAESYRSLRTNLQFSSQENKCNVILVSSTIMAEGKSTTSANLGAIFQMADYKCIVINMDLRKPTLHNYFDIHNNLGMSTYLSSKNSIKEIIHPTIYPNLDIIPSGPIPPNPSELILSNRLDELLDSLREIYDYIIIDSAPLGLVTDTMHLMQYSDMNLIVIREGYSRKIFVTDLNNMVQKHELKHVGIVLNSVDLSSGSYGYGYGYGYGEDES